MSKCDALGLNKKDCYNLIFKYNALCTRKLFRTDANCWAFQHK